MIRFSRRVATAGTVALVVVAAAGTSPGGALEVRLATPASPSAITLGGKVAIVVSLNRSREGTFRARGAISDSGRARARKDVSGGRLRATLKLVGKAGTIKLLVAQRCGKATSVWSVYSGSREYRGLSGGGKGTGRFACRGKAPHRGTYIGIVRTPPPTAIARPGTYSGTGSNPNLRMTFDVLPDGRALTKVSFRQLVVRCEPPAVEFPAPRFTGRYPLAENGQFTIAEDGYAIAGRVTETGARGSIGYELGQCKGGPVNWKVTNPPQLYPSVSPGRYCGFTLAGSGVCIDAASDAWVTRTRFQVKLRCYEPTDTTFTFEYVYAGAIGIRPDLTFAGSLSNVPLPGGGSLRFSVSGKFDDAQHVSGKGGISNVRVVQGGTRYTCRNAVASFTARLGA